MVSTLDGYVSAINPNKGGTVQWSINTGRPLLKSSISKLEVKFVSLTVEFNITFISKANNIFSYNVCRMAKKILKISVPDIVTF